MVVSGAIRFVNIDFMNNQFNVVHKRAKTTGLRVPPIFHDASSLNCNSPTIYSKTRSIYSVLSQLSIRTRY
jgi:hypothetical protein